MSPWVETTAAGLIVLAGARLGTLLSRRRRIVLLCAYGILMILIGLAIAGGWFPELALEPSLSPLLEGRHRFALLGFAVPAVLIALRSRLPRRRERASVTILAGVFACYTLLPFAVFAVLRDSLRSLPTRIDPNGVCRQHTGYTCGPAAAVTALRRLGYPAEEGELAVLLRATPIAGTGIDTLVLRLRERYGADGLSVEYRRFRDARDLPEGRNVAGADTPTIIPVKHGFLVDHFVTVIQRDEDTVTVGDPLVGLRTLSFEDLRRRWRSSGVILERATNGSR